MVSLGPGEELVWPDHQVRCVTCGRGIRFTDAKPDGWTHIEPLPDGVESLRAPVTVKGLCWRCDREQRAGAIA
jgi:Fe2+ or Zn2+ uptake regulation protein